MLSENIIPLRVLVRVLYGATREECGDDKRMVEGGEGEEIEKEKKVVEYTWLDLDNCAQQVLCGDAERRFVYRDANS